MNECIRGRLDQYLSTYYRDLQAISMRICTLWGIQTWSYDIMADALCDLVFMPEGALLKMIDNEDNKDEHIKSFVVRAIKFRAIKKATRNRYYHCEFCDWAAHGGIDEDNYSQVPFDEVRHIEAIFRSDDYVSRDDLQPRPNCLIATGSITSSVDYKGRRIRYFVNYNGKIVKACKSRHQAYLSLIDINATQLLEKYGKK